MEKVIETMSDYFLRYTADIPANEIDRHQPYSRSCECQPKVAFDEQNGWHTITHRPLEKIIL